MGTSFTSCCGYGSRGANVPNIAVGREEENWQWWCRFISGDGADWQATGYHPAGIHSLQGPGHRGVVILPAHQGAPAWVTRNPGMSTDVR